MAGARSHVVNTALPTISVDLGASNLMLQWIVDSYVLVLAGLLLIGGSLGSGETRNLPWSGHVQTVTALTGVGYRACRPANPQHP